MTEQRNPLLDSPLASLFDVPGKERPTAPTLRTAPSRLPGSSLSHMFNTAKTEQEATAARNERAGKRLADFFNDHGEILDRLRKRYTPYMESCDLMCGIDPRRGNVIQIHIPFQEKYKPLAGAEPASLKKAWMRNFARTFNKIPEQLQLEKKQKDGTTKQVTCAISYSFGSAPMENS